MAAARIASQNNAGDLAALITRAAAGSNDPTRGLPPIQKWNPPFCGDIDMEIRADGTWFYMGTPIGRQPLVRLFSTVLRKDEDGRTYLVTPVEKVGIRVQDAPFVAVEMVVSGHGETQVLTFRTNVGDVAEAGAEHPLRFVISGANQELKPYLRAAPAGPLLRQYLDSIPRAKVRTIDFLVGLNQRLQKDISYLIRMEPGVQSPQETLSTLKGSCRDSGWLLVQILRHLGFAARFVSGYLIQLTPDVKSLDGPSGTDHDFTDLHAWCEVFLPGAGWIEFDPTNALVGGKNLIRVAVARDAAQAAPLTGSFTGAPADFLGMKVEVEVTAQ